MRFGRGHVFPMGVHNGAAKAETNVANGTQKPVKAANVEKGDSKASKEVTAKRRFRKRWFRNICRPQKIVRFLLEDWLFLAVLGVIMATLSLAMDTCIDKLQTLHMNLMNWADSTDNSSLNTALAYIVWIVYTMAVTIAATIFVHYCAPQAIGSGIPEMKTILRGVVLKEYLSFRTLVSKMVGLTLAIGSGFPIGKEGPFVHVGSIVSNLISRLVRNFKPAYVNEARSCELLAAGCAAGVACTFCSPVGGVLFSIEVTAVYFAVRDYWRGFFAACCGSALFSLLRLYTHSSEVTVLAFYQTTFKTNSNYYPEELFFFALIGLFCGLTAALFILIHRHLVLFLRRNCLMKFLFQRHWIIYPIFVSAVYATVTHPKGAGQYITGAVVFSHSLRDFFMNCTWSANSSTSQACAESLTSRWSYDESIFGELAAFVVGFYFLAILSSTLPVPAGIFMPVFVIGAGMGRFFGEVMAYNFPDGMRGDPSMLVYPGVYSVVGAASFCGAVTHTVSVAVIAFELTGQLVHILPVMIAVIIANISCSSFQPSFFDSIIKIKHLPYLPDIPKSTSQVHSIRVDQIMMRNVKSLNKKSTFRQLQDLLVNMPRLRAFPVVDDPESNVLLGSVNRAALLQLLESQVGDEARFAEAERRAQIELEVIGVTGALQEINRFTVMPVFLSERRSSTTGGGERRIDLPQSLNRRANSERLSMGALYEEEAGENPKVARLKTIASAGDVTERGRGWLRFTTAHSPHDVYQSFGEILRNITLTLRAGKKHKVHKETKDLTKEERRIWERRQLRCVIDFSKTTIDPAPFQLVEDTSLYKVHSLFSLLGIRRAYVTKCGVLVGVVSLREVRIAIEKTLSGQFDSSPKPSTVTAPTEAVDAEAGEAGASSDVEAPDDEETDTDDEDCILPRVEVEEKTLAVEELSQILPLCATTNTYVLGGDDSAGDDLRSPSSSSAADGTLADVLSESLTTYLGSTPSPDQSERILTVVTPVSARSSVRSSRMSFSRKPNRHVSIVEPMPEHKASKVDCVVVDETDLAERLWPKNMQSLSELPSTSAKKSTKQGARNRSLPLEGTSDDEDYMDVDEEQPASAATAATTADSQNPSEVGRPKESPNDEERAADSERKEREVPPKSSKTSDSRSP